MSFQVITTEFARVLLVADPVVLIQLTTPPATKRRVRYIPEGRP